MALGGDAGSDEKVLAFMAALRTLQTTVLLIDHMTKGADSEDRGAFGSAYKKNQGRSMWEMRQAADGELTMGLYHRKTNLGRLGPPRRSEPQYHRGRRLHHTVGVIQPMRRDG